MRAKKAYREDLVERVEAYRHALGLSEHGFGMAVVNDGKLLARLRAAQVTLRTVERVERYMADNPPPATSPGVRRGRRSRAA